MLLLAFSPNISTNTLLIGVFYGTWPVVHNTNGQDHKNNAIALLRPPSSLIVVDIKHNERQLLLLLVWVDSASVTAVAVGTGTAASNYSPWRCDTAAQHDN